MKVIPDPTFGDHYSPEKLFQKLRSLSGKVIALVMIKALVLYELLKKHDTPLVVKAGIIAVLGYLISPIDAVPDFLPGGYVDDIALMAGLVASLDYLITGEMKRKAEARAASMSDNEEEDDDLEDQEEDVELDNDEEGTV